MLRQDSITSIRAPKLRFKSKVDFIIPSSFSKCSEFLVNHNYRELPSAPRVFLEQVNSNGEDSVEFLFTEKQLSLQCWLIGRIYPHDDNATRFVAYSGVHEVVLFSIIIIIFGAFSIILNENSSSYLLVIMGIILVFIRILHIFFIKRSIQKHIKKTFEDL
jgi:hypothetical protein